jgi:hypothetical protein
MVVYGLVVLQDVILDLRKEHIQITQQQSYTRRKNMTLSM